MTAQAPVLREHGNSYNIFILVLTLFSLAIMAVLLLPLDDDTRQLLTLYDNVICFIFLGDFAMNVAGSRPRRAYLIGQRGWLDLLGSIPSVGFFQLGALLRLARLSRLARIGKLLSGKNRKALVADVLHNRGQYATFITILAAGMVLSVASVLVLQFESGSPDANIKTGGDAIWWGIVSLTTVGYGDFFPVTFLGRLTGVSLMVAGIGIIGALASILASMLVSPATPDEPSAEPAAAGEAPGAAPPAPADAPAMSAIAEELAGLRAEIAALRASLPGDPP
jgi:voltage-gated potassium channel